jgi:hypothetical protein
MKARIKFEPRDLWFGVYWNLTESVESSYRCLDVYVCIVPVFPIKLTFEWGWRNPKPSAYSAYYEKAMHNGEVPMNYSEWKKAQP